MKPSFICCSAMLASYGPCASAWGTLGHATVAQIASNYLTAQGKSYVAGLLGPGVTMPSIASYADTFRYTADGKFSAPYHFIDAEDNPPTSCGVDLGRDCGAGGCVVSAIANYTQRVNDGRRTLANRKQALEFLIHFIGDITQPLHDEAEALGGNQIAVTWQGQPTNLHATWDTQMVENDAGGGNTTAVLLAFASRLQAAIDTGAYASQKATWVSCVNVNTASACALQWAQDANAYNCQYVLKANETGQELSGSYYTGAKPIIEIQIAKAGYRLGAWINALAAAA
ncbi:nuclease PA3 [Physcia stellaris]|nr:nuclease PA3 [Physcia stellaris]